MTYPFQVKGSVWVFLSKRIFPSQLSVCNMQVRKKHKLIGFNGTLGLRLKLHKSFAPPNTLSAAGRGGKLEAAHWVLHSMGAG